MYKLTQILKLLVFFMIIISSSCILDSRKNKSCTFDTECEVDAICVDKKCKAYLSCVNSSDCSNSENCIEGLCKERICLSDDECGTDEYCGAEFNCLYIPKKDIGDDCFRYGNMECSSNSCIADDYRFFCTQACETQDDCPLFMVCGDFFEDEKLCLYFDTNEGDYKGGLGSDCSIHGQSDCMGIYSCVENIYNKAKDKCLMDCVSDIDCYNGYKCMSHSDNKTYCMPPREKKTGQVCNKFGELECKNDADNCVKVLSDKSDKYCTSECETDDNCLNDTVCKEFETKKYCMVEASSGLGESCKGYGNQQCKDNLICDRTYIQGAICTKACELDEDCSSYSSCSITYNKEKLCRPAVNGLGARQADKGETCFEHGDSDCKENLFCLSASLNDKDSYCTSHCESDLDCEGDFHCADTTKTGNKICVKGKRGDLGSACYNGTCNQDLFCNLEQANDYTASCSRVCDNIGEECEKLGFYCNKVYSNLNLCLEKEPELEGDIGDLCVSNSCKSGLSCIFDINGNFCSSLCDNDNLCPEGFICEDYDENNKFCYSL